MPKLSAGPVSFLVIRNAEVFPFDMASFHEPESISPAMVEVLG